MALVTAPTTDPPVIITEHLTKTYSGADFNAVDDLNLSVYAGEIFGLLGPNGAGKTTTAGMLTTRVIPSSGTATVAGINVVHHPAVAKQSIDNLVFRPRPARPARDVAGRAV